MEQRLRERVIQYDGAHSRCITDFVSTTSMTSERITTCLDLIKQRVDIDDAATTLQTMIDQLQQISYGRDWLRRVLIAGNNENITIIVPVKGGDQ
jgi:hypothetical protein